jgi:hypothetical protein
MAFVFLTGDKRRRKRSSNQAGKPVIPQGWASQSAVNVQTHRSPGPVPQGYIQHSPPGPYPSPPLQSPPANGYMRPAYRHPSSNSTLNLPQPHQPNSAKSKSSLNRIDQAFRQASQSVNNLQDTLTGRGCTSTADLLHHPAHTLEQSSNLISRTTAAMNSGAALCDIISSKLDAVITSMDGEEFSGNEQDLVVYDNPPSTSSPSTSPIESSRALNPLGPTSSRVVAANHFQKVWLYANSRLPPHMPPFKV